MKVKGILLSESNLCFIGKKGRRGRRGADDDEDFEKERHRAKPLGTGYGRSELFKVEKGLLHYG